MASTFSQLLRLSIRWARPRLGEVGKLAVFFTCYMIYAWRTFHAEVCQRGDPVAHLCPPSSIWLRLSHHLSHPVDILSVVFLRPRDPADRHDGLSCATFLLGGVLAVALGPASADARRSCNWRLAWLLSCVFVPKGFLLLYGLLHPSASMGSAVNTMLPRHTALMVWLSLAFPLVWRKQALLAAVYVSHMLAVIRLAATRTARPWPYDGALFRPAAVSARLVVLSALSVAVAAAWDGWRSRAGARAAAGKDGKSSTGLKAGAGAVKTEAARRLGSLRQRRAAAAAAAAAGGGAGALAAPGYGSLRPDATAFAADASDAGDPGPASNFAASSAAASQHHMAGGGDAVAAAVVTDAAVAATPPPGLANPTSAAPAAAAAAAMSPWRASRYHLPPPQRYRSANRRTRMYVKMGGVEPLQLDPNVVAVLFADLSARGFLLIDIAVRRGCIEVVLELQDIGGGGSAGLHPDFVRRVVSTLAAATGGAAAAAATAARPVQAHMGGVSYLLTYSGGAGGDGGWHIWMEAEAAGGGADGCGDGCGGGDGGADGEGRYGGNTEASGRPPAAQPGDMTPRKGGGGGGGASPVVGDPPGWAAGAVSTRCSPARSAAREDTPAPEAPTLAVVLPPCVPLRAAVPAPIRGVAGVQAASAAWAGWQAAEPPHDGEEEEEEATELEFTLFVGPPPGYRDSAVSAGAAAIPLPEVLAWQCGRFLRVLRMEEVRLLPGEQQLGGPGSPVRSYSVRLDAREVSHGLISFGIRGDYSGGGRQVEAGAARALVLPAALAAVAEELSRPLSEEALTALLEYDADGVQSNEDFLTDLATWLAEVTQDDATALVQSPRRLPPSPPSLPPKVTSPTAGWSAAPHTTAAAASEALAAAAVAASLLPPGGADTATNSAACTAAWPYSEPSVGPSEWEGDTRAALGGMFRSHLNGVVESAAARDDDDDDAGERAVPWDWHTSCPHDISGACGRRGFGRSSGADVGGIDGWAGGGGRGGGGARGRGCASSSSCGGGARGAAARLQAAASWGSIHGHAAGADEGGAFLVVAAAELDAAAAAEADVAAAVTTAAAVVGFPLTEPRVETSSRMLSGGRLDLRDGVTDAVRAAHRTADLRALAELHWLLLGHAVQCGWPAAARLLLGLLQDDCFVGVGVGGGGGAAAVDDARHRRAETEATAADNDDEEEEEEEGVEDDGAASMLHLAVSCGVPAVVDAVVAAGQLYGTHSHPCGVYGTWTTVALLPQLSYLATAAAVPLTPLDVAAALPDGGAMLSYILRRYPGAAAQYDEKLVAAWAAVSGVGGAAATAAGLTPG